MNYDSQQLAEASHARRTHAGWPNESPAFDSLLLGSYTDGVDLLCLVGAPTAAAVEAVENALAAILHLGNVDASTPFVDALSLTFLIRSWRWDAVLREQWHAHGPHQADPPTTPDPRWPFQTRRWFFTVVDTLDPLIRGLVQQVYRPLNLDSIVALLEVPAVQVGLQLTRCWGPPPQNDSAGPDWSTP